MSHFLDTKLFLHLGPRSLSSMESVKCKWVSWKVERGEERLWVLIYSVESTGQQGEKKVIQTKTPKRPTNVSHFVSITRAGERGQSDIDLRIGPPNATSCLSLKALLITFGEEWNPAGWLAIMEELTVPARGMQTLVLPDLSMQLGHPKEQGGAEPGEAGNPCWEACCKRPGGEAPRRSCSFHLQESHRLRTTVCGVTVILLLSSSTFGS